MQRHRLRDFAPSAEGMTFLRRSSFQSNGITKSDNHTFVFSTINHIDKVILQVFVDYIASLKGQIPRRHRGRNLPPTAEVVTLFGWNFGSGNRCSVNNMLCLEQFAIQHVSYRVTISCITSCDRHIIGGHGYRQSCPTSECMTFPGWSLGRRDCCTIRNVRSLEYLSIQHIDDFIGICDKTSCYCHILFWHNLRQSTPSCKTMSFFHRISFSDNFTTTHHRHAFIFHSVHHIDYGIIRNGFKCGCQTFIFCCCKCIRIVG